jgi:predicted CXXCH cytochrome family protein
MASDKIGTLCAACHANVAEATTAGKSKHEPAAAGDCTACHNPHRAALKGLLLAKSRDLCLGCHSQLKSDMDGGQVHSPAARDCLRCHQPHASGEAMLLAKPARTLCAECHNTATAAFGNAHLQIDPARMRCERCHDAHASKAAKLFKSNAHPPFAMKSCQDCHLPVRAGIK